MLGKNSTKSLQKKSYTGNITKDQKVLQFETRSLFRDVLRLSKIIIIRKKNVTLEEIDLTVVLSTSVQFFIAELKVGRLYEEVNIIIAIYFTAFLDLR